MYFSRTIPLAAGDGISLTTIQKAILLFYVFRGCSVVVSIVAQGIVPVKQIFLVLCKMLDSPAISLCNILQDSAVAALFLQSALDSFPKMG